eukprot:TRINITY_DN9789_c0_g1_i1.p1 TRINITY_DN9789_c0_g1~~TRINITY_DN9789_c0_g1_i1.p1  ORF type:complete len:403 (+),score=63.62 TRINITY_DN9789_c0_g1_i1:45-1253(+)
MIRFEMRCDDTHFGDVLAVVGSGPELGDWNPAQARHFQTSRDLFPLCFVELPSSVLSYEFKGVIVGGQGQVTWERIPNRRWNLSVADMSNDACVVRGVFNEESLTLQQTQSETARPSRCRFAEAANIIDIPIIAEEVDDVSELFYETADYWDFRSEHSDVFAPEKLLRLKDYCISVVIEQARQRDLRMSDDDAMSRVAQAFSRGDFDSARERAISLASEQADLCSESPSGRASGRAPSREAGAESERVGCSSKSSIAASFIGDAATESEQIYVSFEVSSASSSGEAPSQELASVSCEQGVSAVGKEGAQSREAATESEQADRCSKSSMAASFIRATPSQETAAGSEQVDLLSESSSASCSGEAPSHELATASCKQGVSAVGKASWVSFCFPFLLSRREIRRY